MLRVKVINLGDIDLEVGMSPEDYLPDTHHLRAMLLSSKPKDIAKLKWLIRKRIITTDTLVSILLNEVKQDMDRINRKVDDATRVILEVR